MLPTMKGGGNAGSVHRDIVEDLGSARVAFGDNGRHRQSQVLDRGAETTEARRKVKVWKGGSPWDHTLLIRGSLSFRVWELAIAGSSLALSLAIGFVIGCQR